MAAAVRTMKPMASTKEVQPASAMPFRSPAPKARPTRTVTACANPERDHEGERGDLDGDGVRGQGRRADQAHEQRRGVEDRHLEGERRADGQAETPELAEALPIRSPEAAEEAVALEAPVGNENERQDGEHQGVGDGAGEPRSEQAESREAQVPEDKAPVQCGVDDHRQNARHKPP